jgi:septal ring factor EnvC (AmiA/AmiB activator)
MDHPAMPAKKIGRSRPVGATPHASREEFLRLRERLEETMAAVERLQHDYAIQVQRTAELQATIDRLVQHVQALTTALGRPRESE